MLRDEIVYVNQARIQDLGLGCIHIDTMRDQKPVWPTGYNL